MNSGKTAIDTFARREWRSRGMMALLVLLLIGAGVERWRLVARLNAEPLIVVVDEQTIYLPKGQGFAEARDLHVEMATLALESLFDRGPKGPDHEDRLKRLFDKTSYRKAMALVEGEAGEFELKGIHQKVEIAAIASLKVNDAEHSVLLALDAQLLRVGDFNGQGFTEGLEIRVHLRMTMNPGMIVNGRYPTIVRAFEVEIPSEGINHE